MKARLNNITIKTVAQHAGVSTATAARVLGNYGSVSEKTRKRVLECAQEITYVPNAIAKSMRKQYTKTIGMIVGDIQTPFFGRLAFCVENYATRQGWNLLICNTNDEPERELMHLRSLFEHQVDGIILSSTLREWSPVPEEFQLYYTAEKPIVQVDRYVRGISRPVVQCNNEQGSYEATKYLLELGHRQIGVIASQSISSMRERLAGFRRALEEYGLEYREEMVRYCEISHLREPGMNTTRELLEANPGITALYGLNQPLYRSIWMELQKLGIKVADDISVIGWGDSELADAWGITVVAQPIDQIAMRAASILFEMIHKTQGNSDTVEIIDTKFIRRNSCKKLAHD